MEGAAGIAALKAVIGDPQLQQQSQPRRGRRTLSKPLEEARAANQDNPDILITELEPLPQTFVKAFGNHLMGIPLPSVDTGITPSATSMVANMIIGIPPIPALMYNLPSVAPGSGSGAGAGSSGGSGTGAGGTSSPRQRSNLTTATAVSTVAHDPSTADVPSSPLSVPRTISSLPGMTTAGDKKSLKYFRQADVTYRSLETKHKLSEKSKREMLEQYRAEWQHLLHRWNGIYAMVYSPSKEYDDSLDTYIATFARNEAFGEEKQTNATAIITTTTTTTTTITKIAGDDGDDDDDRAENAGLKEDKEMSEQQEQLQPQPEPVRRVLLSGPDSLGTTGKSHDPAMENTYSEIYGSNVDANNESSSLPLEMATEFPPTPPPPPPPPPEPELSPLSMGHGKEEEGEKEKGEVPAVGVVTVNDDPAPNLTVARQQPQRPQQHQLKKSSSPLSYDYDEHDEQSWEEARMRALDDTYWNKVERDRCLETSIVTYGLDKYLAEIARDVEYEPFETVMMTDIINEN
ncbi:hypothetical protein BG004_000561, partial [Podila humilis]